MDFSDQKRIYLAAPGQHKIGQLNGIASARLTVSLQDIWTLDLEIDKYLYTPEKGLCENRLYQRLNPFMELFLPEIGWFRIDSLPEEKQEGDGRIYKTLSAKGIETQLGDIDLLLFHINTGLSPSYELFDENLNAFGVPERNIRFYIPDPDDIPGSRNYWKLGLLNILEREYLNAKGWQIGQVDSELQSKTGRMFEIDSASCYNTLTDDLAAAYKCIFTFDRVHRKIHAHAIPQIGRPLNLELSFRNLIQSASISSSEDRLYTSLNVAGGNENTSILYVNFGSERIFNLSYLLNEAYFPKVFCEKYAAWTTYRDSRREEYAETFRSLLKLQKQISSLKNRQPIPEAASSWNAYSLEELKVEQGKFRAMLDALEQAAPEEGSENYILYLNIRDVILPDIAAEIARKEGGSSTEYTPVDYSHMWELYGILALKNKLTQYQNTANALKEAGYHKPWDETAQASQAAHERQYQNYLNTIAYIGEIRKQLALLEEQADDLQAKADTLLQAQKEIIEAVSAGHEAFGFSSEELSTLRILSVESDYTDSSIEVLNPSDADDLLQSAWELYDSACKELEIISRPQTKFSIPVDNLFLISQFKEKAKSIRLGDFLYLELDGGYKTKQRIIGMEIDLLTPGDSGLTLTFSDAVNACGKIDDYRFLLGAGGGASKNSISRSTQEYIKQSAVSAADNVLSNYFGTGTSVFPGGISQDDLLKLADSLNGLIDGTLTTDRLKAKLAEIDSLNADDAFIKNLETIFFSSDIGKFNELSSKVGYIDTLLSGTSVSELSHIIKLTAQNVDIDEAVIRDLIAAHISVGDLKGGTITLSDSLKILSENGRLAMNGETLQILGTGPDGLPYVAVQLGYDAANKPSLTICDGNGAVMLDADGLHEAIVPEQFIKTDMIGDHAVTENKIDKSNIREWIDDDGSKLFDVGKLYYGDDQFEVSYTTFRDSVTNKTDSASKAAHDAQASLDDYKSESASRFSTVESSVNAVSAKVDENSKSIEDKISKSQTITVYEDVVDEEGNVTTTEESVQLIDAINHTVQRLEGTFTDIGETVTMIDGVNKYIQSSNNQIAQTIDGIRQDIEKSRILTDEDGNELSVQNFYANYVQNSQEESKRFSSYMSNVFDDSGSNEDSVLSKFESFVKTTAEGITHQYITKDEAGEIARMEFKETADNVNWLFDNRFSKDFTGVQFNAEGIVVDNKDADGNTILKTTLGSGGLQGYSVNNGVQSRIFYLTETGSGQKEATIDTGIINFKQSISDTTPSFKTEIQNASHKTNGEITGNKFLVFIKP